MIKFLIEKEFKQLLRNSFLPKLILVFPCMIMLLMPWAVNLEIKNIQLNIVDNDHSAISQRLVNKIAAATSLCLKSYRPRMKKVFRNIEIGTAGYCDGNSKAFGTGLDEWRGCSCIDSSQCREWNERRSG